MLRVVGQQCCVRLYGPKSLTGFKLYATSANTVVVPANGCNMLGPTMLRVVGQKCCVGLHGPLGSLVKHFFLAKEAGKLHLLLRLLCASTELKLCFKKSF